MFREMQLWASSIPYICANGGGNFQHTGYNFVPREHTKDSLNNIPCPSLELAINLIEKNVPNNIVNVILNVQSGRSLTLDSLKQLRNVVLAEKSLLSYKNNLRE